MDLLLTLPPERWTTNRADESLRVDLRRPPPVM